MDPAETLPLGGTTVIDASRMLPGAVLVRMLIDLGARVIKIEDPRAGDLMRLTPPLVDGIGVGYCAYFRGAESVTLDLRSEAGAAALRTLATKADVLLESFRPGTLDRWGIGLEGLRAANPRLITASIPGFTHGDAVGHDLNFVGLSGLLHRLRSDEIPAAQLADCTAGSLACSAILAALLHRSSTGVGLHVTQPLAGAPLHFMTWAWAEETTAGEATTDRFLGGKIAAYRTYTCADGLELAVGCLEPKFWVSFCQAIGLPELAARGHDPGAGGTSTIALLQEYLSKETRSAWLDRLTELNLPVTPVHDLASATNEPLFRASGLIEETPLPDGGTLQTPGPSLPSLGRTPERPAPRLGQHTRAVLAEFGVDPTLIDKL